MKEIRQIRIAVTLFGLLFLVPCLMAGTAQGSFEKTLSVSGAVELDISSGSGNIHVTKGNNGSVRVKGHIQARDRGGMSAEEKVRYLESHPPMEQTGNTIRIGRIEDREYSQNVSISYEVETPAETKVTSRTGSGTQTIDGMRGPVEVSTGSGNITVSNIADQVRAKTGSGDIVLNSISAAVQASTGSGSIRGNGVGGPFKGDTGSGHIGVNLTAPGDVDARTGSGSIEASGVRGAIHASTGSGNITVAGDPTGEWKVNTSSGDVTLRLGANASFELAARTSSGRIDLNHPVTVMGTLSKKEIHGKVRSGGALVDVHTSSGNISIE